MTQQTDDDQLVVESVSAGAAETETYERFEPDSSARANGLVIDLTTRQPLVLPKSRSAWEQACKRVIDVLGASLALILLSPVFAITALSIALTSPGPVLFRQVRVGRDGEEFSMLKFRSMYAGAEQVKEELGGLNEHESGPVFKIRNDPRITSVGRFIRRFSIDELPQLVHVLSGEMSLVGPRPPIPEEVDEYGPRELTRLTVKPGLTCIWQVSGRSEVDFETWMEMDIEYIDNWSLALDFKLLLRTIYAVVSGRGAY